MKKKLKNIFVGVLISVVASSSICSNISVKAAEENAQEYTIYPSVHSISYSGSSFSVSNDVNVVYETGIDEFTIGRNEEVMAIKGLNHTVSNAVVAGKTNILIGINGSNGVVDNYVSDDHSTLFGKTDSYLLSAKDNVIAVLGKNTDSAFYGLTSLKHIFNQMESSRISEFVIEDYADVKGRGFIEGYYGNPWSDEDRMDLMKYGGDYKLNQYIYAPKDDPKHNSKWRELYTQDELADIANMAEAGNRSKCYYVYALHTFMYNAVRFNTEENYQADLTIIKNKFTQLMGVGVKQFAILADDAGVPSGNPANYTRLMKDITAWLIEKQEVVPGLKSDTLFCPNDYMGNGSSIQMQELKKLPESVSIIQTGGAVWGQVSSSYLNSFTTNMGGRSPYMWINWPCSDNTKDALIMGGNERFLNPGVDASKIEGIVLNPMQQSEANKSALFANADFAWNIWKNQAEVDQNWHDSFNYMDHGTIDDTDASIALRELSKHMKNSNTGIPESVELAPKLNAFKASYEAGEDIGAKADELIGEFSKLKEYAVTYKKAPGNQRTLGQIHYWMDCWVETMDAGINYLKVAKALQSNEDAATIWDYFTEAQTALEKSKTHTFLYIDFYQAAKIGRQHITPFVNTLDSLVSAKVSTIVDPTKQVISYVTNRSDTPTGNKDNVFDQKPSTELVYKTPNSISVGTYVGITYTNSIKLNEVKFLMGSNGNLNDTFSKAKVQYTSDGKTWVDINNSIYSGQSEIVIENLDLDIKGIRLIATEAKSNTWLGIRDITVNPSKIKEPEMYQGTVTLDKISVQGGNIANISDGNPATYTHFAEFPHKPTDATIIDYVPVDATITKTFTEAKELGTITLKQDVGTDKIVKAVLEYSEDGISWKTLKEFTNGEATMSVNMSGSNIKAKAVRIRNKELNLQPADQGKGYWWKVFEFSVSEPAEMLVDQTNPLQPVFEKSSKWSVYQGSTANLVDGNPDTDVEFNVANGDYTVVGDYIGYDLGRLAYVGEVDIVVGGKRVAGNKWEKYKLEYSTDNVNWTTYKEYSGLSEGKDTIHEDLNGVIARYVRLTNKQARHAWVIFSEFTVKECTSVPAERYTITNTDYKLKTAYYDSRTELICDDEITLNKDQYIGIALPRIKDLSTLDLDLGDVDLTIQTSLNMVEWSDVSDVTNLKDARYIRVLNKTTTPVQFQISEFAVNSNEIQGPSLFETTMGINSGWGAAEDTRNNGAAFDGDVNTKTEFADLPQKGQYITYDLGQLRDIDSLQIYVQDSEGNYIRDAKVLVSEDNKTYKETGLVIGDGVENLDDSSTNAVNSGLYKASSTYPNKMYVEANDIGLKARYVKILMTASYQFRAVVFNEIVINNWEYCPTINDPTFESDVVEVQGFAPQNMFDGDLTTAYKPSQENGQITYYLSENLNVKKINIIQKGEVSNAKVFANVKNKKTRASEKVLIGTLNKSLNEILLPFTDEIYDLTIEWTNKIPLLSEIILIRDASYLPDRTALQSCIDGLDVDATKYTTSSYNAFHDVVDEAKATLAYNNSTQKDLNTAVVKVNEALTTVLVLRGDVQLVQVELDKIATLDESEYTSESWAKLATLVDEINEKLKGDQNDFTQAQVAQMVDALQKAIASLDPLAPITKDMLVSYLEQQKLDKTLYLTASFAPFEKAIKDAEEMLEDANATSSDYRSAMEKISKARVGLILKALPSEIDGLKKYINQFEEENFTVDSWKKAKVVFDEATKKLSENEMTSKDVTTWIEKAKKAASFLVIRGDVSILEEVINGMDSIKKDDYTKVSYDKLQATIKEAEAIIAKGKNASHDEVQDMMNALAQAKSGLAKKPIIEEIQGGNGTGNSTGNGSVQTGDQTNIWAFSIMGLLALGSMIGIYVNKKNRNKKQG